MAKIISQNVPFARQNIPLILIIKVINLNAIEKIMQTHLLRRGHHGGGR